MDASDEPDIDRDIDRLRERFQQRALELAEVGFFLRGSIAERYSRCGSKGCGCKDDPPRLHGPYWQWTRKVKGKTVTRNLSDEQNRRCQEWIDNAKRADHIVHELGDLSVQADEILRARAREARDRSKSKKRAAEDRAEGATRSPS